MLDEIWKDIENYENVYQISNIGRVRRIYKNGNTKILKQDITKKGYYRISLSKNQKHKHYQIHRLVAKAFITNPNNYPNCMYSNNPNRFVCKHFRQFFQQAFQELKYLHLKHF